MRKYFVVIAILLSVSVSSQNRWSPDFQKYIDQYKDIAIKEMERWNIPASITLAQGLLESGAGKSDLAIRGNNHFGIKCHDWTGPTMHHDDDRRKECFRVYNSAYESYEDHSKFLASRERYRSLFFLDKTDYKGWARGLKAAGYATNPKYPQRLIDIIQLYKLYQYDTAEGYDKVMYEHTKMETSANVTPHQLKMYNENYYIRARQGDTFRSLGKEFDISYKKLAKYNERDKNDKIVEGEIIWLKKKQKKAPREYEGRPHYVKSGESIYSIAQTYGIRLKYLFKMNNLSSEYKIRVGDPIRLR